MRVTVEMAQVLPALRASSLWSSTTPYPPFACARACIDVAPWREQQCETEIHLEATWQTTQDKEGTKRRQRRQRKKKKKKKKRRRRRRRRRAAFFAGSFCGRPSFREPRACQVRRPWLDCPRRRALDPATSQLNCRVSITHPRRTPTARRARRGSPRGPTPPRRSRGSRERERRRRGPLRTGNARDRAHSRECARRDCAGSREREKCKSDARAGGARACAGRGRARHKCSALVSQRL